MHSIRQKVFTTDLKRIGGKAVAFLLVLCLLLVHPFSSNAQESPQVRILLTALQLSNQLHVGIYGGYLLNDHLSFQRGSTLTIELMNGSLMVYYEGMAYRAGESLLLKRHDVSSSAEENGLRLQNGLSLYTGDLKVHIKDGQLRAVLILPVEEYLLGVIPYEMAEDFPLEALKAQSVAARTYTIKNMKPTQDYDLVDSTNDQVYRGLDKVKVNAIRAVRETSGIILAYQGSPAHCFYTASNGGVTESAINAWGREVIPYLQVQEDPYDLENPRSEIRAANIPKELLLQESNMNAALFNYLHDAVRQRFELLGYDTAPEFIKINSISGIVPHTVKYGGNAGVMKYLRFDLNVSGRVPLQSLPDQEVSILQPADAKTQQQQEEPGNISWSTMMPLPQLLSVDCAIFPDIEEMLLLSINQNANEIVHIREELDKFIIIFSRYGHGVGMSQRGAEWMAKTYRWNYKQILRFYYPGTEIEHIGSELILPQPLTEEYLTTPGPIPTPTPRPTLMPQSSIPKESEHIVIVSGVTVNSSLNLRAMPDLSSKVITRLYFGQELLVIDTLPDGWLKVKTDVVSGYIREEFVSEKQK